jgi:hypothetical protein
MMAETAIVVKIDDLADVQKAIGEASAKIGQLKAALNEALSTLAEMAGYGGLTGARANSAIALLKSRHPELFLEVIQGRARYDGPLTYGHCGHCKHAGSRVDVEPCKGCMDAYWSATGAGVRHMDALGVCKGWEPKE